MWLKVLKKEIAQKGPRQVAKELGVSHSTIVLVCHDKYGASTERIEKRVMAIYGKNGNVECPVLGKSSPDTCANKWRLAKKIGVKAGNPETLKLYKSCLKCSLRRV